MGARRFACVELRTAIRCEELVRLKVGDIDGRRMVIPIRQGEGRKDRDVILSPRLLEELRDYWRSAQLKPKIYLFPSKAPGQKCDRPMQAKSVFDVVRQARPGLCSRNARVLDQGLDEMKSAPFLFCLSISFPE